MSSKTVFFFLFFCPNHFWLLSFQSNALYLMSHGGSHRTRPYIHIRSGRKRGMGQQVLFSLSIWRENKSFFRTNLLISHWHFWITWPPNKIRVMLTNYHSYNNIFSLAHFLEQSLWATLSLRNWEKFKSWPLLSFYKFSL